MDSVGCSFKTIMSLSILLFLSTLLPRSLGQVACDPNPCLNGGDCRPGSRRPQYCLCPIGFLGEYCGIERRIFCQESPCINGGTCIPVDTGGYCKCTDNFWGSNCELLLESPEGYTVATIISMATGTTIGVVCLCICVNTIYCISNGTGLLQNIMKFITIVQMIGISWSGLTNAICDYNYCLNGGTCTDWWGTRFCDCEEGFNGEICQYEPCLEAPCQNGGDCHAEHASSTGAYTCTCYGDYYGTECQYDFSIHEADLAVGIIIAIVIGGVIGIVFLAVCIGCLCYDHHSHASSTVAPTAPYVLQPQYPLQLRYPSAANTDVSYKSYEPVQLPQPAF